MSLQWIADRLHMGSWTYVSNLLRQAPTSGYPPQMTVPLFEDGHLLLRGNITVLIESGQSLAALRLCERR